jgi:hypothetical protein
MRKDLCDFLKNRALLVSMLATVVLAIGFVKIVDKTQATQMVHVAMVGGAESRLRVMLALLFSVESAPTEAAATQAVEQGRSDFALVLPAHLDMSIQRGEKPSISVITRKDAGPRTLAGLAALTEALRAMAGQAPPFQLSITALGAADDRRMRIGRLVSGWLLFVLIMGMTMVAASLVEERESGTLQAIVVGGGSLWGLLAGKALYGLLVCLVAALAIAGTCGVLAWSPLPLLILLVGGSAFVVGMGLCLGAVFPNIQAANAGLSLVFLVLFVPVFLADVLQGTPLGAGWTQVLPSRSLLDGLQQVLEQDQGWRAIPGPLAILGGWAVLTSVASWFCLRAEQAR